MTFPVEEKYVLETESTLNVKFPKAYRDRIMKENGGEIKVNGESFQLLPVQDKTDETRSKTTSQDIVSITRSHKNLYSYHPEAIAVGQNAQGDLLVFIKEYYNSNKLKKGVFLWDKKIGFVKRLVEDFSQLIQGIVL